MHTNQFWDAREEASVHVVFFSATNEQKHLILNLTLQPGLGVFFITQWFLLSCPSAMVETWIKGKEVTGCRGWVKTPSAQVKMWRPLKSLRIFRDWSLFRFVRTLGRILSSGHHADLMFWPLDTSKGRPSQGTSGLSVWSPLVNWICRMVRIKIAR